jgi:hypothetical protein
MYGLSSPLVIELMRRLPNADKCKKFVGLLPVAHRVPKLSPLRMDSSSEGGEDSEERGVKKSLLQSRRKHKRREENEAEMAASQKHTDTSRHKGQPGRSGGRESGQLVISAPKGDLEGPEIRDLVVSRGRVLQPDALDISIPPRSDRLLMSVEKMFSKIKRF